MRCTSLRATARSALVAAVSAATALALALPAHAAPGDLDTTFSGDGKTTTDFSGIPAQPDIANDVAVQSDGKIVAVGRAGLNLPGVGGTAQDAVARYNTDGTLDTGFGTGGKVRFRFFDPPNTNFARSVFVQADGKILVAGLAGPNEQTASATIARLNTDGTLDTGFDGDGKVTLQIPNNEGLPLGNGFRGIAQQADGKIVAAGAAGTDAYVARFNTDGSLDTTYGSTGTGWERPPVLVSTHFFDLRLDSAGRAVVAGFRLNTALPPANEFLAARFTTSGVLDTGFNSTGVKTVDLSALNDLAFGVAFDGSKIVLAGVANITDPFNIEGDGKVGLVRLNADGSLDTGFGSGGTVVTQLTAGSDEARDVQVQSNGKIVVCGVRNSTTAFPTDPVDGSNLVARYNGNGTLDSGFGVGGVVSTPFGASPADVWRGCAITGNRLVAAGGAKVTKPDGLTQDQEFAVARYKL